MNMKVENEMALPITKSVTVMLLEPYAGKLARTVLRGESSRKGADLLDYLPLFVENNQIYATKKAANLLKVCSLKLIGGSVRP